MNSFLRFIEFNLSLLNFKFNILKFVVFRYRLADVICLPESSG